MGLDRLNQKLASAVGTSWGQKRDVRTPHKLRWNIMRVLGASDLSISPLALGTNTFGWTSDAPASAAVLNAFVDGGGNFIDTADNYSGWVPGHAGGESEMIIGSWLAASGRRPDVIIGTKVGQHPAFLGLSAANVRAAADASLTRLQTDYIDVYFAHLDDQTVPLDETVAAFDALVRAGKIRYVGLSNYSADRIHQWQEVVTRGGFDAPVALQPMYNLLARSAFEGDLLSTAEHFNLGVLPYFGLASGLLTGKYRSLQDIKGTDRGEITEGFFSPTSMRVLDVLREVALAHDVTVAAVALGWLLSRDAVVAPIASARNLTQLGELMTVGDLHLTDAELTRLDTVSSLVPD